MSQIGHDDRRHSWSSDPYWPESECCHARCSDAFPEAAQCPLNEARMPSRPSDMYLCAAYGDGNVTDYASVECTAESCCSPTCGSTAAITNLTCPDGQVLYDGRTCDLESGDQERRQCSSTERCCTEVFVVGQSAPDGAADDTGYDVSFNHFVDSECTIERGVFNGDSGGPLAGPSATCAQNIYGGQTPFIWHGFCGEGGSVGSFEVVLGTSDCLALGESVSLELGGQVVSSGNTSECVLENPSCSDGSEDCVYQMFTCTPSQTMPCTQPPHLDGYLRPIERNASQGNFLRGHSLCVRPPRQGSRLPMQRTWWQLCPGWLHCQPLLRRGWRRDMQRRHCSITPLRCTGGWLRHSARWFGRGLHAGWIVRRIA
eukprot:COSAG06_NODE_2130_length_7521_cov_15.645943_4_plen_372_part_00